MAVRKIVSEAVSDKQLRGVVRELADEKNAAMTPSEFKSNVLSRLNNERAINTQQRLQKIQNLETKARNISVATQDAFKNEPTDGVLALLNHVNAQHVGPMGNARSIMHDAQQRWTTMATIGMKKDKVWDIFKSGKLSREIEMELAELKTGGNPGISKSMEAQKIAINLRKIYNYAHQELKDAGMDIGFIEGFTGRVIHDASKIRERTFGEWYSSIIDKLDHGKTFQGMSESQKIEKLQNIYTNIVEGKYSASEASSVEDNIVTLFDRAAINKQKSRSKSLFFKDGASTADYRAEFGRGDFNSTLSSYIMKNSRDLGLVKSFGTNPRAGYEALKEAVYSRLKKEDPAKAAKFRTDEYKMDRVYNSIDGSLAGNPEDWLQKSLHAAQVVTQTSKMGFSVLPAMTDFNTSFHLAKSASGKNMAETVFDNLSNYFKSMPPEEKRKMADFFGRTLEEGHGTLHSDYADGFGGFKGMAKLQKTFFDINPLTYHTEYMRLGMTRTSAADLADNLSGTMTANMVQNLERYGVTGKDFSVLREMIVDVDGHKLVDPAMAEKIDPGIIQNYLDKNGINKTVNQYRKDIRYAVSAYYDDFANRATATPSDIDKQRLLRGTKADDKLGIALRLMAQFKAPSMSVLSTYSRLAQSTPGKSFDTAAVSSMFIGAMASGYMILFLKDLAAGKTPRDPKNIQTTIDAAIAGGGATLWGDALFQDYRKMGGEKAFGLVAGPSASTALKGIVIGQETIKKAYAGKANPTGKQVDFALQNVPFANQIFARKALDYILLNDLQEHLDPGFMQRKQDREKKKMIENSQSYIFGQ